MYVPHRSCNEFLEACCHNWSVKDVPHCALPRCSSKRSAGTHLLRLIFHRAQSQHLKIDRTIAPKSKLLMATKILLFRLFFVIPLGLLLSFAAHAIDLGFFDVGIPGKAYLHTPRRLNSGVRVTVFLEGKNSVLLLQGKDFYIDG